MKLFRVMAAAACALLALNAAPVLAQTYPTKPITIVVGFAPGGVH